MRFNGHSASEPPIAGAHPREQYKQYRKLPDCLGKSAIMLRHRLIFPVAGIVLVLSLVLTGLWIWTGNVIVSVMSERLIREATQAVRRDVGHLVRGADKAVSRLANGLVRHDLPLDDPHAVAQELYGLLAEERDVDWLFFGNEAGGLVSIGRLADSRNVFLMTDEFRAGVVREFEALPSGRIGRLRKSEGAFDSRQRIWYAQARKTGERYWTEPYLGAAEPILGISLSAPVFDKGGRFVGVCGIDLILTQLSRFLQTLEIGDNGRAFIIDATGHLIGASGGVSPVTIGADGGHLRLQASGATDPIVRETARYLTRHPGVAGSSSPGPRVFSFTGPGSGRIYAAVDNAEGPGALEWTIISAVPASDFLKPVYRAAYLSISVGAAIVAAFVMLGLGLVGRTLRPLTALTQAAHAIAKGDWRVVPEVRQNDEVGLLAQAFTLMTSRLKETLEGLRRSEANFAEAQRVAHVGYWERDLDTDYLTWSDETYRIFGLTPRASAVVSLAEAVERIHPEDRTIWSQVAAKALHGESRYELEYRIVRPSGEMRIVHSQGDLTRDASGRPRSMFGTIQDITERKRVEEALRDSEEQWRAVFENNPTMYFMVDAAGAIVSVNPFGAEQLGYTVGELIGRPVQDVFYEADRETVQRHAAECLDHLGRAMSWELRKIRKDGSMLWVRETARAMVIKKRPVILIVCEDITERKRAEEAARRSEDELREVIETVPAMVWTALPGGRVDFINRRWQEFTGLSLNGTSGASWEPEARFHPEDLEQYLSKWRASLATGHPFEAEVRIRRAADGEYRWWFESAIPLRDEHGNILKWYGFLVDIEDRKRAEEALQKAQAELAHVTRVTTMGALTSSIAHEVNQPLAAVVTNANAALRWLASEPPNIDEARETLARIVRDGHRAGEVIGRVRALLKKTATVTTQVDLNGLIEDSVALVHGEVRRHRIQLRTELAQDLPPIAGDRVQLQQVILNLVMNGIETMKNVADRPRELLIRSRADPSRAVLVAVQDTGVGLEPQSVERVFEAFYTTKAEGLGMGLAICRSIIEAHGGRLWARAIEPSGAVFLFTLPPGRDDGAPGEHASEMPSV
ncbi:PAS domain S-box protein [Sinorhizobium sp. 7-81]|uniref:PAS domain S-box protein n=1 Tax=Sinorhizobium sp. 8-89 TaxID=3049089 RepID=UPI0024C31661|nr:PAS domain S-box protein [Sinorhizobium sp. 8-89]MDK1494712.1 PAS domain S-box protein [Sinorhizobium sp. 8-89]